MISKKLLKFFYALFIFFTIISCCRIMNYKEVNKIRLGNNIKEIYTVYDSTLIAFSLFDDPRLVYKWYYKGYKPIKTPLEERIILKKYPVDKYFFIGKFIIDKDKNIEFIPVTSSKGFKEKEDYYKKEDLDKLAMYCEMTQFNLKSLITDPHPFKGDVSYTYTDIKLNKGIKVLKQDPAYTEMFLAGLGMSVPYYLVINEEYGKKLMEKGIIVPDVEEVKANLIWKDWYFKEIIYNEPYNALEKYLKNSD